MNTDHLIDRLSRTVPPVPRHAMGRRLLIGLLLGSLVTLALVGHWLGFRSDLPHAMRGFGFWVKWLYTGSLALCAVAATLQLARPDTRPMGWLWIMAAPIAGLAGVGAAEMARAPASQWMPMWLGGSWTVCSSTLLLLALPIFGGLLWSFRKLAPTRLRAAGATAGLTAGAWAATLYCLHCPEVSAIFVLTWYTLGIGLAALLGALLGPRLLRW